MTQTGIFNLLKLTLSTILSIVCGIICLIHGGLFNLLIGGVLLIGDIVTIFSAINLHNINCKVGIYTDESIDERFNAMNHTKL
jgi:hypothetical protein